MMTDQQLQGARLKTFRTSRNLNRKQVAAISGISIRRIGDYETGERDIMRTQLHTFHQLAQALQTRATTLAAWILNQPELAQQPPIADSLQQQRKARNLTQAVVAQRMGEQRLFITEYENGKHQLQAISVRKASRLAQALGVNLETIITWSTNQQE